MAKVSTSENCSNGHPRSLFGGSDSRGNKTCRECIRLSVARGRARKGETAAAVAEQRAESKGTAIGDGKRMANAATAVHSLAKIQESRKKRWKQAPENLETREVKTLIEEALQDSFASLTAEKIACATPRDLTTMISQLFDKWQLIRGEPTQRVTHEVRLKLDELGLELQRELALRSARVIEG